MKEYKFHDDAGHGWLEVELAEIERLGLTDQISDYSYLNGNRAYLEEDCDAQLFIKEKENKKELFKLINIYDGDHSFIRDLPIFRIKK